MPSVGSAMLFCFLAHACIPSLSGAWFYFLTAEDSPTGYAGVLVAGAWSGTLSLYEFTMADGSKCGAPCAVDGAACANGKTCECTAHARRNLLFASQPHRDHCECH